MKKSNSSSFALCLSLSLALAAGTLPSQAQTQKKSEGTTSTTTKSKAIKTTSKGGTSKSAAPTKLTSSVTLVDLLIDAEELFAEGRYKKAEESYKKLISLSPKNTEAYIGLGRIYLVTGRDSEAIANLRKATQLSPDSSDAHFELGSSYLALGDLDKAMLELTTALELSPQRPEIKYKLAQTKTLMEASGLLQDNNPQHGHMGGQPLNEPTIDRTAEASVIFKLITSGRVQEAIEQGQQALEQDPENASLIYQLGLLYKVVGELEKAIESFERSIVHDPEHSHSMAQLVSLYLSEQDYENARKISRQWVEADPDNPSAHFSLSWSFILQGAFDDAAPGLKTAVQLDPRNPDLHNHYGLVLRELGKKREAEHAFQRALAVAEDSTSPRLNLAMLYLSENRLDEAHEVIEPLNEVQPVPPNILSVTALIEAKRKDFDSAMNKVTKVLKVIPDQPVALGALAEIHSGRGDFDQSITILEQAQEKHPQNVYLLSRLALHHLEHGDKDRARELASRAYRHSPGIYLVIRAFALAYADKGELETALKAFDELPSTKQVDPRFMLLKGEILEKAGKYAEARDLYNKLISSAPQNNDYQLKLSGALLELGQEKSAEELLAPMLADKEEDNEAHRLLARHYLQTKRYKECYRLLEEIENPSEATTLIKARCAFALGKWDDSIDSFKTVFMEHSLGESDMTKLSEALSRAKRPEEAQMVLERARKIEPQSKVIQAAIRQLEQSLD